jgi:hypothetical protein
MQRTGSESDSFSEKKIELLTAKTSAPSLNAVSACDILQQSGWRVASFMVVK